MSELFSRNELIWGEENQNLLAQKHIAVFGLGGVGGYAAEAITRAGVGEITIVDFDNVTKSNINRQLVALHSTIGNNKADLFAKRLKDINPDIKLNIFKSFYTEDLNEKTFSKKIDFAIDAIDTTKSKIQLLETCYTREIPTITSLGAGNRIDPTKLIITDINEIQNSKCSFVKNIIRILSKKNIKSGIKCVVSSEAPKSKSNIKNHEVIRLENGSTLDFTKISPGSVIFVPAVAGYYMAFYAISSLLHLLL